MTATACYAYALRLLLGTLLSLVNLLASGYSALVSLVRKLHFSPRAGDRLQSWLHLLAAAHTPTGLGTSAKVTIFEAGGLYNKHDTRDGPRRRLILVC